MKTDNLKQKIYNVIGIVLILIGAGVLIRTACLTASADIWFDELFTVELANKPIPELISLAALDVHPPLYYILVRAIYVVLHNIWGTGIEQAAKLASIIPFCLLMIYAVSFIRKRFGLVSAGLFMLMVTTMPGLPEYMVEARMYSWAMFAVTAMFIHGWEALRDNTRLVMRIHLAAACIYAILAMYLHYYAFIGATAVALCMLVYSGLFRKEANYPVIACMVICVIAYVPWEGAVLSQVGKVSASYWIQPVSIRTLAGCGKYIFKPEFENTFLSYLCAAILCLGYIYLFVHILKKKKIRSWEGAVIISTLAVPVILVLTGYIASIVIRPVFVYRYMTPVLGVFWLGYAIVLGDGFKELLERGKNCPLLIAFLSGITVVLILVSIRDINCFRWEENKKISGMQQTEKAFQLLNENYSDYTCVYNFNQVQAVLWHYLDADSILWGETDETLVAKICGREPIRMTDDCKLLKQMIDESKGRNDKFLFIGSGNARDEIIDLWSQNGMEINLLADSCLLERYYFNIYEVTID